MDSATLWSSLLLTAQLAAVTTVILLALGTPLAWWLARSPWRWKTAVEAVVALPLENAYAAVSDDVLEAAATLRAAPLDRFFTVVLPQARRGFITAAVLGYTHTVGEFGVDLMIGGNIPGKTQVLSIVVYDRVEALRYGEAHLLASALLIFSFIALLALYSVARTRPLAGMR